MKLFKKIVCFVLALALTALCGCGVLADKIEEMTQEQAAPYAAAAKVFADALLEMDYAKCFSMYTSGYADSTNRSALAQDWNNVRLSYGDAVAVASMETMRFNGEPSVKMQMQHVHGASSVQLIFNDAAEVDLIVFGAGADPAYTIPTPEGVVEKTLTIGEGTDYPLPAILTLPENAQGDVPAVVLVHGSGAADKNGAIGNAAPFADIAHGLAQQGVASIRYDKRTFAHASSFTEKQVQALTVQEEIIDDAILAVEALEATEGIGSIYIVGHDLGGMLAPRIAAQCVAVDGIVSLSGSARDYIDVVYDQNVKLTTDAERQNAIKREYKKAAKLNEMKDSESLLGLPVPYLKDLRANPIADQLSQLSVPVLVLHGRNDVQMDRDDFDSYVSALEGYAGPTQCEMLDDLNHILADNTEFKNRGTTMEYLNEARVAQIVIDKIASWALTHAQ